jgi:hypothetical protein
VQRSDIRAAGDLASGASAVGLIRASYGRVDRGIRSATQALSVVVSENCTAGASPT